ncbi:hypothetical protein Cpin_0137 [Chitinophaga pinensis DSM 2588]|uniref:Uncharacterized protein n=1 Tax=Chitinophaga pinensis (strain ATCC 43595 / DSM 2588 / LMG 13176 / NBRC 15968 / NCIMB 11800 / UQM 2034) TaxID=485918 RepID=A0A979FYU8_CHIPD|nr:hypothetical protein Cpin_0137 [Chitinophaga pinensis DSM 2588]
MGKDKEGKHCENFSQKKFAYEGYLNVKFYFMEMYIGNNI